MNSPVLDNLHRKCEKVDIIFVLEWSGTIHSDDYNSVRNFLLSIGKRLRIGEQNEKREAIGQGAIITYNKVGKMEITLKESQNKGSFARVVRTMADPIVSHQTKSARSLNAANKSVVINSTGYRENDADVSKLLVVISNETKRRDSQENSYKYAREVVQPLIRPDVKTLAVAVGTSDKKVIENVRNMVKDQENAILLNNYRELNETVENFILNKSCPGS